MTSIHGSSPETYPAQLANKIGTDVLSIAKNPIDQGALAALHSDAMDMMLLGSVNQRLQQSVQRELDQMLKSGQLPDISLLASGQIDAHVPVPNAGVGLDGKPLPSTIREVSAGPHEPTRVADSTTRPDGTIFTMQNPVHE
jgi:hypothetical protein